MRRPVLRFLGIALPHAVLAGPAATVPTSSTAPRAGENVTVTIAGRNRCAAARV